MADKNQIYLTATLCLPLFPSVFLCAILDIFVKRIFSQKVVVCYVNNTEKGNEIIFKEEKKQT